MLADAAAVVMVLVVLTGAGVRVLPTAMAGVTMVVVVVIAVGSGLLATTAVISGSGRVTTLVCVVGAAVASTWTRVAGNVALVVLGLVLTVWSVARAAVGCAVVQLTVGDVMLRSCLVLPGGRSAGGVMMIGTRMSRSC